MNPISIVLIGCGAIGSAIAKHADTMDDIKKIYLFDQMQNKCAALRERLTKAVIIQKIEDCLDDADLVIECASQQAVKEFAPFVVARGKSLMILSVGAFADQKLYNQVSRLAEANRAKVYVPSGAICGIDGIKSARAGNIEKVTLTTTKPVNGLKDAPYLKNKKIDLTAINKKTILFEGPAKEAIAHFPENVNVAACLSLAGIGFEKTRVTIVADPSAKRNKHEIIVKGSFGDFRCTIRNVPSPDNPKTSYLAALSAIATLKKITSAVQIGT